MEKVCKKIVLKTCWNEQDLEFNIINVYPTFETLRITHSYTILTQLLITLSLQGSNDTPAAWLLRFYFHQILSYNFTTNTKLKIKSNGPVVWIISKSLHISAPLNIAPKVNSF